METENENRIEGGTRREIKRTIKRERRLKGGRQKGDELERSKQKWNRKMKNEKKMSKPINKSL